MTRAPINSRFAPVGLGVCVLRRGFSTDARSCAGKRRDLVTKRLSSARRHEDEGIVSRHDMLDDIALASAERVIAVNGLEYLQRVGGHGGFLLRWMICASWPNPDLSQSRKAESATERETDYDSDDA